MHGRHGVAETGLPSMSRITTGAMFVRRSGSSMVARSPTMTMFMWSRSMYFFATRTRSSDVTALIFAARDGRLDIALLLIGHGAQIDRQDDEKVTALIIAAFRGHDSIVDLLLDHGAAVDIRDQWRRTALDYALRRGDNDAVAVKLRAAGARTGAAVE